VVRSGRNEKKNRERHCSKLIKIGEREMVRTTTCIFPKAPIQTSGGKMTGLAYVPPIYAKPKRHDKIQKGIFVCNDMTLKAKLKPSQVTQHQQQLTDPILESVKVPPVSSLGPRNPFSPNCCSLPSSSAMPNTLLV